MLAERIRAPAGKAFVQRALCFYLAIFGLFWIFALLAADRKAHREGKPFGPNALSFERGTEHFGDFLDIDTHTERIGKRAFIGTFVYPPPMDCFYLAFSRNFQNPLRPFLWFCALTLAASAGVVAAVLYRSGANRLLLAVCALITVCAGYPFLFLFERGNPEVLVFLLVAAGLGAFFRRRYLAAGILIALAASMKIFPGLLFALLISRKRYKELAWSLALIIPVELVSLWIIGPTFSKALADIRRGMEILSQTFLFNYNSLTAGTLLYDHSLFGLAKGILHLEFPEADLRSIITALGIWYTLFVGISGLALWWFLIRKAPILNQAMVLLILSIVLPYMSLEYTLVHLYLVWALFLYYLAYELTEEPVHLKRRSVWWILGLLAFLFAPVNYITGRWQGHGGIAQGVALLVLAGAILTSPMPSERLGADPGDQDDPIGPEDNTADRQLPG